MATTETINILRVDGQQAITTLKELKAAIEADKDALVALGTVEDDDIEKQQQHAAIIARLAKEQKLLTEVMTASRGMSLEVAKGVNVQTESYNTLQRALTTLKRAWKDMTAEERASAGGTEMLSKIKQLDAELKSLDGDIGQYQRNVGNYGQTFKAALDQARAGAHGLMQGLTSLNNILALSGEESSGFAKVLMTVQTAFAVINSAKGIGDFIVKGAAAIKTFLGMSNAAKATAAGMQAEAAATTTATVATKAFRAALISTGIGAIIALIASLISHLDDLAEAFGGSSKEAKRACDEMQRELQKVSDKLADQVKLYEAGGAIKEAVMRKELESLVSLTDQYRDLSIAAEDAFGKDSKKAKEAFDTWKESSKNLTQQLLNAKYSLEEFVSTAERNKANKGLSETEMAIARVKEQASELRKIAETLFLQGILNVKDYTAYILRLNAAEESEIQTITEQEEAAAREKAAAAKKAAEEKVAAERNAAQKIADAAEEAQKSEVERLTEKYQKELALLEKFGIDSTDLTQKYNDDMFAIILKSVEAEEKAREDAEAEEERQAREEMDLARKVADQKLADLEREETLRLGLNAASLDSDRERADKEYEIQSESYQRRLEALRQFQEDAQAAGDEEAALQYQQEAADLSVEIEILAAQRRKQILDREQADRKATQKALLSSTSSILGSLADMQETNGKNDKKAQKRAKNLRIAAATIDMFQGATTAYTSAQTLGPILGPIVGAANAAAVIATGINNINKIKQTEVSDSSSSSAGGVSVAAPVVQPAITEVRTLTGVAEEERLNESRDIQVYILESDIEATNKKTRVRTEETTF